MTDNYYGFESTNDVKYDNQGAPIGTYKVMIIGEEADTKGRGLIVEYEIVNGDSKGKKFKTWYMTLHENATTANIAKQAIKRIADATGKAVSPSAPLKGRVLVVTVGPQKNDADRTEIKKYHPEGYEADEGIPL